MNKEELQNLVNTSSSISDIIRRQGKAVSGTSIKLLKQEFDLYQIDYHFLPEKSSKKLFHQKIYQLIVVIISLISFYKDLYLKVLKGMNVKILNVPVRMDIGQIILLPTNFITLMEITMIIDQKICRYSVLTVTLRLIIGEINMRKQRIIVKTVEQKSV